MGLVEKFFLLIRKKFKFFSRYHKRNVLLNKIHSSEHISETVINERVKDFINRYPTNVFEKNNVELSHLIEDLTTSDLKEVFYLLQGDSREQDDILELQSQLQILNKKIVLLSYSLKNIGANSTLDQISNNVITVTYNNLGAFKPLKLDSSLVRNSLSDIEELISQEDLTDKFKRKQAELVKEATQQQGVLALLDEIERLIFIENFDAAASLIDKTDIDCNRNQIPFFRNKISALKTNLNHKVIQVKNAELLKKGNQKRLNEENIQTQRKLEEEQLINAIKQKDEQISNAKEMALQALLRKKRNWDEFAMVFKDNSIGKLYHFTDRANLQSIRDNKGLYSWYFCVSNNIEITRPGGGTLSRELDRHYSTHDFVRLSFTKSHPMMFKACKEKRIVAPVVIEIDIEAAFFENTQFSNMNATKTGHSCGSNISNLNNIRFDIIQKPNYFDLPEDDKRYYQAEVLVKTWIPIEMLKNIDSF